MNITRKDSGDLTATLTLEISPDDYKVKIDETLRSYKRKASIPGFRPGKVPFGIIHKMYGKAVLIDEVHKIMSEAIYKYIDENKIEIFGNPILNDETAKNNDWENAGTFIFDFDIALIPEIEPELDSTIVLPRYNIVADNSEIESYLKDIRERYGKYEAAETVAEGQFIYGDLYQLNPDKSELVNGIKKPVSFWVRECTDEFKNLIMGLPKQSTVEFIIEDLFPDVEKRSEFFRINQDEIKLASGLFGLKILSSMVIVPAEIDAELFAKVFPDKNISSEEELRATIEEDIKKTYIKEAGRQFFYDAQDLLREKYPIHIPEDFLKKWVKQNSEKELSEDDINQGFPSYAEHLKWQIIENKLIKKYEIKAGEGEFRNYVKELVGMAHINEEEDPEGKAQIDQIIQSVVQKEEDIRRIYDGIYEQKLTALLSEKCIVEEKNVTWKEFLNLVQKN